MVSIKRPSGRHVSDAALAAVTDDVTEAISRGEFLSIPLYLLRPDPDQPRKSFPETMIEERAAQLHEWGQLHPITVKPLRFDAAGNKYYPLIDGECRWRAAQKIAGLDALDAKIDYGAADDATRTLVMQALSNDEGRQPLLPTERASMYAKLVTCYGTQAAAAKALGIGTGTFSQVLSINAAPEAVKALATEGIVNDADTLGRLVGVVRKNKKTGEAAIEKIRQSGGSPNGQGRAGESAREIVVRAARSTRQPKSLSPALTAQRVHLEKSAGEIVLIVERGRDTHRFALSEPALAELLTSAQALKE
jgi:ParB family chromosome partitioning protein